MPGPQAPLVLLVDSQPCFNQLMPICSKRLSFRRYMFCAMTGWSLACSVPPTQLAESHQATGALPILQEVVPTE